MRSYKDHTGMIIDAVMAILMGLFMGISVMLINHVPFTWVALYSTWARITLTVTFINILVPGAALGDKFAEMLRCRPGTIVFTLVSNLVPTFIVNTVLTALLTAMDIFYNDAIPVPERMGTWIHAFFTGWTPTYIIAFFMGLLSARIGRSIAERSVPASR